MAVCEGGFNGIEAYAEQVAFAGALSGHDVTLVATNSRIAEEVRQRLPKEGVRIIDLGLEVPSIRHRYAAKVWPPLGSIRLGRSLRRALSEHAETFDVAHVNHTGLVGAVRPLVGRVCVGAWFYPHHPLRRLTATFHHSGHPPRSLAMAVRSLSYYLQDELAFRQSDCVLAPTTILADQLQSQGVHAIVFPPPARLIVESGTDREKSPRSLRFGTRSAAMVTCSADLSSPRKNVRDAIRAARLISSHDRPVRLEVIGGNGQALRREVAESASASLEIVLPGRLPPAEVHERMRRAGVFIFPSLYEEWGYAAAEALLCGTPVVSYPVYPFEYMLNGGLGLTAHDRTVPALAAAVERALAGESIGDVSALARERFGAQEVAVRLARIWQDVTKRESVLKLRGGSDSGKPTPRPARKDQ